MVLTRLFNKSQEIPRCSAVIVAAGSSSRMGEDKTLMELGGIPVLARTLLVFQRCELITEIVVVTRGDKITQIADMCKSFELSKVSKVITGGATRMESSLAGVSAVEAEAELIAIHDGARPLVTNDLLRRTVLAAASNRAAAPAVKSIDTLKAVDGRGYIIGTVDRETTLRIQTPQIFDADLIKGALSRAVANNLPLTDDCSAMEMMGVRTYIVEGDENNIKLTTPRDVMIATAILKQRGAIL